MELLYLTFGSTCENRYNEILHFAKENSIEANDVELYIRNSMVRRPNTISKSPKRFLERCHVAPCEIQGKKHFVMKDLFSQYIWLSKPKETVHKFLNRIFLEGEIPRTIQTGDFTELAVICAKFRVEAIETEGEMDAQLLSWMTKRLENLDTIPENSFYLQYILNSEPITGKYTPLQIREAI